MSPTEIFTADGWVGYNTAAPPSTPPPTRTTLYLPGAKNAPFNLPLATTATFEGNTGRTARLLTLTGGAVNSQYWSVNFAQATLADPVVTLRRPNGGAAWTNLPWPFRMPPNYQPPLGTAGYTPDGATFIINADKRYGVDLYRPVKISDTIWECPYAPEVIDFHGSLVNAGARAANISYANGVVRNSWIADVLAGTINCFPQAIAFSIPYTHLNAFPVAADGEVSANGQAVYPANMQDNQANVPYSNLANNLAMGAWFAIPTSTNIETLISSLGYAANSLQAALFRTLYYRGAVITDQSTSRAMYVQPGATSGQISAIDAAWDACISHLRRVTNITSATPGGGAYDGSASNRLLPLAVDLAA